jgi:putative MATE family efflux protein
LLPMVHEYMYPWFFGLAFMGLPTMTDKSLSAMGDTKTPAKIMMLAALVNVVLDPVLIFGFGPIPKMGIEGASWATVFSRIFATFAILYALHKRKMIVPFSKGFVKDMWKSWKEMVRISIPTSLNTMTVHLVILILNKVMAVYGLAIIAGLGVAVKIEAFAAILLLAVGESMPSFIGQNFGARRHDRIESALNCNAFFAIVWSVICFIIYKAFGNEVVSIFTQDSDATGFAVTYLLLTCISYSGVELMYASHSLFNSIDKSRYSVLFTVIQVLFIIVSIYVGAHNYGVFGGVMGLIMSRLIMGYAEFGYAKFLLYEDADKGRFVYLKPHFIKHWIVREFHKRF